MFNICALIGLSPEELFYAVAADINIGLLDFS